MQTKPFIILQLRPEDETSDNEFEAFLKFGELRREEVRRIRAEQIEIPKFNFSNYSAIIVGGSPFDVSKKEAEKTSIQKRVESDFRRLFKEIIAIDFPFLGACSGNGLLGDYCGANISSRYSEPVGGVDIFLTEDAQIDSLLKGLPNKFRALVGHKEACDSAPVNSVLLAGSNTCPVQMFRVRQNIYATQFHPEADSQGFELRINIYKYHGYFSPDEAGDLIERIRQEVTPVPQEILRRFVEKYRQATI